MRQNAERRTYNYAQNQKVLKKVHDPTKLGIRTSGPYKIKKIPFNGTVQRYSDENSSQVLVNG